MARFERILLTGAAGALGTVLREGIGDLATTLRVSDREGLGPVRPGEEAVRCDLADKAAVLDLAKDVDAVVHLGGIASENTFETIASANIHGLYNVYEAARLAGVKRIVWASSNHAIGFYRRTRTIDAAVSLRPDSLYGVSKAFGEAVAQFYFDKFGLESVSMRIGSCFPEPTDRRMLATWLSYPDLVRLVTCALTAPRVDHMIVYGCSDNREVFWDNRAAASIGFRPRDTAEVYRDKIEAATAAPDPDDRAVIFQGGSYAAAGHPDDKG